MTTALAIPDVGYLDGLDPDVYHAHPALSSGQARTLLRSPARYRWELEHRRAPTREMVLGTCVHTEILGVGQDWAVLPGEDLRIKAVKDRAAEIEAQGEIPLKPSEARLVLGMADAVRAHPEAGRLLAADGAGTPERAMFWRDPDTGVHCRALVDWTLWNGRALVDLKTTVDASPDALPRHMDKHGYHIQAAHYLDGARALDLADGDGVFIWVFVEREPPHPVTVARLDAAGMRLGHDLVSQARQIHRDCTETGLWPGTPDHIITVTLPPWTQRAAAFEEYA